MAKDSTLRVLYDHAYVEWDIHNYFELPEKIDHMLHSSSFNVSDTKWFIRMHPSGQSLHKSSGWIGLYLHKEESAVEQRVAFTMGIKRPDGTYLEPSEGKCIFEKRKVDWGWPRHLERSTLLSSKDAVAPDGTLTVFCSVRSMNNVNVAPARLSDGILALSKSFKDLYEIGYYTDIILRVINKEFHAHKLVLAARSTVFASILQKRKMKLKKSEKRSATLHIDDCDPDTFKKFLLFLYTGELDSITSKEAVHLYKTADKYQLNELKEECVYCLRRELTVNTFFDVVHLAYSYKESDLLKFATEFFTNNAKYIIPQWNTFLAENQSLGNDLLLQLIKVKDSDNEQLISINNS